LTPISSASNSRGLYHFHDPLAGLRGTCRRGVPLAVLLALLRKEVVTISRREGRQPGRRFADFGKVLGCTDPPGAARKEHEARAATSSSRKAIA